MKRLLVLSAMVSAIAASAALPPKYERTRQIKEIVGSEAVVAKLDGPIEALTTDGQGNYFVADNKCGVDVKVECGAMQPGLVGPCPLKLTVGERVCQP